MVLLFAMTGHLPFRVVICGLAAVGVILTDLSAVDAPGDLLRQGEGGTVPHQPGGRGREVYIIGCLLVPIIGIGLYPKLMTDSYRSSIEALVTRNLGAMERVSQPTAPLIRGQGPVPALVQAPSVGAS